jgi:hypothetical protein
MKPLSEMTVAELAAYVAEYLRAGGVEVVLSGGACVTIYGDGQYVTGDLDFVVRGLGKQKHMVELLSKLGFSRCGSRLFSHPETRLLIDTLPEPLCVGREPVQKIERLKYSTGELDILSPTDCVKDRLAQFYHWDDYQCCKQAASVAGRNSVDLEEIKRWSQKEGSLEKFKVFLEQVL